MGTAITIKLLGATLLLVSIGVGLVTAQTTELTYQGSLKDGASPANGNYDFEFRLYDLLSGGTQIGSTVSQNGVAVSAGTFAMKIDFGSGFPGGDRYLEIRVRNAGGGGFTILDPRQRVNSSPYAIQSLNASIATNATQLAGVPANQYVTIAGGNASYILNSAVPQASSNFNISGNGTAGGALTADTVRALTQFNIGGIRVLSIAGTVNTFVGSSAGLNNTGTNNTFVGSNTGLLNTTGTSNAFFGSLAGNQNTTGNNNAFFGRAAGQQNVNGNSNAFFGDLSGFSNTSGSFNTYFGAGSGNANQTGAGNSFFGSDAGLSNTGTSNSFFGRNAGRNNTTGVGNTFFGTDTGVANTTGANNAFFGVAVGGSNTLGLSNSFFGASSVGASNTTGNQNSFFGDDAGFGNTTGSFNTFVGGLSGRVNKTGTTNTTLGYKADFAADNLTYATAIGADAVVSSSNSIVLGRAAGQDSVKIPGSLNVTGTITGNLPSGSANYIQNTTSPQPTSNFNISGTGTVGGLFSANIVRATTDFYLGGSRMVSTGGTSTNTFVGVGTGTANTGANNIFFGSNAGLNNTSGSDNSFVGHVAGNINTTGSGNSFFGNSTGAFNTGGDHNSFFGNQAGMNNTTGHSNSFFGYYAGRGNTLGVENTFIGVYAGQNNTTGNYNSFFGVTSGNTNTTGGFNTLIGNGADVGSNNLSFATAIGANASVNSSSTIALGRADGSDTVVVPGKLQVDTLGAAGATSLCINGSNRIASCSSSLRYKTNLAPYSNGLNILSRLRPITFDWKEGGMHDLGLGAEDVAAIDPLLVTYNSRGQVEGVKYDRVGVVLINAVTEQQQIIERQQQQIDALTKLVCLSNPNAGICK